MHNIVKCICYDVYIKCTYVIQWPQGFQYSIVKNCNRYKTKHLKTILLCRIIKVSGERPTDRLKIDK